VAEDRWARMAESGSARALRLGARIARAIGPRLSSLLLWPVAAYYVLRNATARRGSLQYQRRLWASPEGRTALGRRPGWLGAVRHLHEFAVSLHDRMLLWGGGLERMQVSHDGSERIFELTRSGRGALLLGAHLGSLDMLSFLSRKYDLVVNVVAFFANARRVNAFFESLSGEHRIRLIELEPDSVQAAFRVRERIARGELVVVMADRMAPGKTARTAQTTFLGRPARFPLGPFLLACVLECPVLFALCLRTGAGRYETLLRPIGETARVARAERDKRAGELLARYVTLLEQQCQRHPHQWFNFFEFWPEEEARA
jgi:predicted LPLAT superfamily acyltransferase